MDDDWWPEAQVMIVTTYDDAEVVGCGVEGRSAGYALKENLMEVR